MEITGTTPVFVHLAHPAAHVRTPSLFNARCERRGLNAVLVPWDVSPPDLSNAWEALRRVHSVRGVIVTVPHKQSAAGLCDRLEGDARILGVVNVARKLASGEFLGRLYDGRGFVEGLRRAGIEVDARRVLLLGAGGAATAIAHALASAGIREIAIANRSRGRAEHLLALLRKEHPNLIATLSLGPEVDFDIIVNATSLGLKESDPLPVDVSTLRPGTIVAETVMVPALTALLMAAREKGAQIHLGEPMLRAQIDNFIDFLLPTSENTTAV